MVDFRKGVQDYESLRVAVMICDNLVNTQTHTHTERERERAFDLLLAEPAVELNKSYC